MAENYDLIFGSNASQSYSWSDVDYQKGWETVGDTPPLGEQFDALQRRADNKAKDLNDRLTPIESNNTNIFRQPSTAYALKDIRFYPELPAGWYFECKIAGTTDAGDITMPSPILENDTVVDGTVTWTIRKIGSGGGGEAIGVIKAFAGNGDIPAGYLLCDGAAYSRTMLPDLFAAIGTTYGSGDGSTTFNVPDYNQAERFAQGSAVAGTVKQAGLPNITGSVISGGSRGMFATATSGGQKTGALSNTVNVGTGSAWSGNTNGALDIYFDASQSNPIYGASNTVQPNALTTRYIIKAFDGQTPDSALIDITQYASDLANKADRDLSNLTSTGLTKVLSTVSKAQNGYQIMGNGLIIQWGQTGNVPGDNRLTVAYPISFPTACLSVVVSYISPSNIVDHGESFGVTNITKDNFVVENQWVGQLGLSSFPATWIAIGY